MYFIWQIPMIKDLENVFLLYIWQRIGLKFVIPLVEIPMVAMADSIICNWIHTTYHFEATQEYNLNGQAMYKATVNGSTIYEGVCLSLRIRIFLKSEWFKMSDIVGQSESLWSVAVLQ